MSNDLFGYVRGPQRFEIDGFTFYSARRADDERPCLLKVTPEYAIAGARALEHEVAVLSRTPLPCALEPLELRNASKVTFIAFTWFAGLPLLVSRPAPWPQAEVVRFAQRLCRLVQDCHERGVVHGRLDPGTILSEAQTGELRLAHFVAASSQAIQGPRSIGLGPCSAPEQSGGVALELGAWTDLYAFGCILHHLLAGRFPFEATDREEFLRRLVSEEPVPLARFVPDVSSGLSALVERLLAKRPNDRPPSAAAVCAELDELGRHCSTAVFVDFSRPRIRCDRMHGRDEELASILRVCREAGRDGTRVVWLSGAAGLGKSRMLAALRLGLRQESFLVATGKFDQYRQQRPYSAFLQALHGLIEQLLTAPEDRIQRWAQEFAATDPALRAIWVQQLPILEHLIGTHPEPLPLRPKEAANRFASAMSALMDVLCRDDHPLVLCIDDFQWADDAAAELLGALVADVRRRHLVLVMAFRNEGLSPGSRAAELYESARTGGSERHTLLALRALRDEEMNALCAEAVNGCGNAPSLWRLVRQHADGNPFVALEILRQLERTNLLVWGGPSNASGWHLEQDAESGFTFPDSTSEFLAGRLRSLSPVCRRMLAAASCIGHSFRTRDLVTTLKMAPSELSAALVEAKEAHWITTLEDGPVPELERAHRFCHDRMQQVAALLPSPEERQSWHRALGLELLAASPGDRETVFRAADYLSELPFESTEEAVRVARLCRTAGEFARDDVAYRKAVALFSRSLELLTQSGSEAPRRGPPEPMMRDEIRLCQLKLGEARYLSGDFEGAEQALARALELSGTAEQVIKVHKTRFALLLHRQEYSQAISQGVGILRSLGYRLPERPAISGIVLDILLIRFFLGRRSMDVLQHQRDETTAEDRDILDVLILLSTPAYWTNERLSLLIGLRLLRATLRAGNIPQSPMAYANWAILNQVVFRSPARALEFGMLAEALLGPSPDPFVSSRVRFVVPTFVGTLMRTNRENVSAYEEAYSECLRHGEHVFAGHCIDGAVVSLPMAQFSLPEVEEQLAVWEARAARIGSETSLELIAVTRAWCRAQMGVPLRASDAELVTRLESKTLAKFKNAASCTLHRLLSMLSAYLRGDCEEVLRVAALVEADRRFLGSNPVLGAFHGTLAVMSSSRVRRPFRGRLAARHVKRLRQLSSIFRQNFRPFTLLADGELAWSRRQSTNALRLLKEAIADSVEHGNDLTHALACECLAAHYEELGDSAQHREFLSRAAYGFGRFGAHAKLRRMTEMHPGIGAITRSVQDASTGESVEARLSGVLRSIDAIADERRVEKLAQRLLQILTSSAGSQRGVLARNDEGTWRVLAAVGYDGPGFDPGAALEEAPGVPRSIVRYALRTQSALYLDRPAEDPRFGQDACFVSSSPLGVVCLPIPHRGRTSILVYLENNLSAPAFDANLKRVIEIIGRQTAVSLATADHHKLQMDALQARINPHFLYNTLSTIAELVIKDPTAAESALVVLARLYRYMLASSWDQVVSLRQELDITKDYLAIEKHRFGERLDSRIEVVGVIDDVNVPALLLQPIAENAVRHGIAKKARPGRVQIYVYRDQNSCKVRISDDGPGLDPSKPSSDGFGFGLRSVVQRLDLLYGNKYRMSTSSDAGYTVELQFPVSTGSA